MSDSGPYRTPPERSEMSRSRRWAVYGLLFALCGGVTGMLSRGVGAYFYGCATAPSDCHDELITGAVTAVCDVGASSSVVDHALYCTCRKDK